MRVHRVYMSFAISIGCGIASQNVAFSQEYRGTAEQQMACTPDVWRLCGAQIPDVDRIVACLRRNTAQLSEPCRAVIEPTANSPRRRDDQPRPYDRDYRPRPYDGDYGRTFAKRSHVLRVSIVVRGDTDGDPADGRRGTGSASSHPDMNGFGCFAAVDLPGRGSRRQCNAIP